MNIGIVAGEKSGDFLASQLIIALKKRFPQATFCGLCGPLMQAEGARSLAEMDKISIFGLEGLLGNVREILKIRETLYQHFMENRPDVFIGVDVPDFNLRLERRLKEQGIPTVHYVSPTVWAWRSGRVKKIQGAVNLMLSLFPFEQQFYREHQVPVEFVGHPLAEQVLDWRLPEGFREKLLGNGQRLIAVLPGSRMSEVSRLAPQMIAAATTLVQMRPELRFVIPAANNKINRWLATEFPGLPAAIRIINGQSRDVLAACDMAALASGTAALEAALFAKPMVVMYKVSMLAVLLWGLSVRVEHFSMPNHLTKTPVVPELLQGKANAENLIRHLTRLLDDDSYYAKMQAELTAVAPMLSGDASARAAEAIGRLVEQRAATLG